MRFLYIILFTLIYSSAYSAPNYRIYRVNGQNILVPKEEKKQLEGYGVTFNNTINFETVKDPMGVETKKAWLWIGGCGKTYISDQKVLELKEGTRVRVRMSTSPCSIQSWEKF